MQKDMKSILHNNEGVLALPRKKNSGESPSKPWGQMHQLPLAALSATGKHQLLGKF